MKKSITLWITATLLVFFSSFAWSAKTYLTTAKVDVYDEPNGNIIQSWPSHTLFTSNQEDNLWIRVSGHFPEGEWQSVFPMWYVKFSENLSLQKPQSSNAPATIFHVEEDELDSNKKGAQAYRLLEQATVFNRLGEALEVWPKGKSFTSAYENEDALKVTGHFPNGSSWQAMAEPVWIIKPIRLQNRTQPKPIVRKENTKRLVIIDKSAFNMTVYEQTPDSLEAILTTPVALGYDRCLPKSQGGKCYYTPEGEFEVEFKLFDSDGIKWCIPKKMEAEFTDKIARGERCWRGIMGQHALHFGDSLFLHGTSNPDSIGSRTTHGCVRLRNSDIEWVYRLLENGDKVIITSNKVETVANLKEKQLEALANANASKKAAEITKTKAAEVNALEASKNSTPQEN
ncbi:L,D-transpeptidase [Psychrosphaera haliotis]|uniref:L,D-transpeptidase n=1 Tax=Psychrosphaera haliotis TaxID=555083 RepID=UPI0031D9910C